MDVKTLSSTGLDTRKMPIALFISDLSATPGFPGNVTVSVPPNEMQIYRLSALQPLRREGEGPRTTVPGPLALEPRRFLTASPTEVGMANPQNPVT